MPGEENRGRLPAHREPRRLQVGRRRLGCDRESDQPADSHSEGTYALAVLTTDVGHATRHG